MKGIKNILFGILLIMIAGFFMVSPDSSMFGYGELALFIAGVVFGIKGLKMDE